MWSVLALAAKNRQMLTYSMMTQLTGMMTAGVGHMLEPIQSYCLLKGWPPLTALVVSESTGLPGIGFIAAADVPKALVEVFAFNWLEHGAPSPEEFSDAVRKLPSNGATAS
jgi:hypothetical protein